MSSRLQVRVPTSVFALLLALVPIPAASGVTTRSSSAEITRALSDAIRFVEKVRQVKFKSRPRTVVLNEADFRAALRREQASDPASIRQAKDLDATLTALGFLQGTATAQKLLDGLTGSGVLGYYSPKTKTMTIRGTKVTPLLRTILVHELTHALDDQRHNLDRPQLDDVTDGTDEAFIYLVEGTARWVENKYRDSLSQAQKSLLSTEELKLSFDPALTSILFDKDYVKASVFLLPELLNPYELGKILVADLVEKEGTAGLEKAFGSFPTTTEQASSYAKYSKRERAISVATPPFDGTKVVEGVFGVGGLNALFTTPRTMSSDFKVSDAVEGWGGDRYVVFTTPDKRTCLRLDVAMDTDKDRLELKQQLEGFAESNSANVSEPATDRLRLDSCTAR